MEKQHLSPMLALAKYNKIDQNDIQFNKFGIKNVTSISQTKLEYDDSSLGNIDVQSILNDENDSIIDELFEKNKLLQARWSVMQQQLYQFQRENENLKELLADERLRAAKFQKKLSYIQENQPVFEKLRQAYMSLKYNEQKFKNLVEVTENGTQTDPLTKDASNVCFISQSENTDLPVIEKPQELCNIYIEPGFMPIKKQDFNNLKNTVETLQTLIISKPLSTFVLTENKEAKYRKDIAELFMENRSLKQLVVDQQIELDTAKQQISIRKTTKESSLFKKIIAKLERQIRSAYTGNSESCEDYLIHLNETEKKIVEHISTKYELKLQQKLGSSEEGSCINTSIMGSKSSIMPPSIYSPPISKHSKRPSSVQTPRSPKTPRCSTPFYTPRSEYTDGCDTYRSCDNF